jgi:hypothetical protein
MAKRTGGRDAPTDRWLTLAEAADLANYSPYTLKTLRYHDPDPPPFEKYRGKLRAREDLMRDWIARREQRMTT